MEDRVEFVLRKNRFISIPHRAIFICVGIALSWLPAFTQQSGESKQQSLDSFHATKISAEVEDFRSKSKSTSLARALAPEFHIREGLPNLAAKIAAGRAINVAFLGGSITAAQGWRVHVMTWLKARYPETQFKEIFAAVSGTGSDYGAPRLQRDVLRHRPDIVFIEFAVNDGSGSPAVEAQMEGIVRQSWIADPLTDLLFVYTISAPMLPDILAGRYQSSARSMEKIADHYGIPSFNFGIEIARRVSAGTTVMSAPENVPSDADGLDPEGRLIFTRDNTHPTPAGHLVYFERLKLALPEIIKSGIPGAHSLPTPYSPDHWQRARLVTIAETRHDPNWRSVPPEDIHATTQMGPHLVPPLWASFEPGAKIEFRFKGTVLGIIGLKGPENGLFRVTVDDLPPQNGTLFDQNSRPGRFFLSRWYFPHVLSDTDHRVSLELLPDKIDKAKKMLQAHTPITDEAVFAPHGLYIGGFLIVGEPLTEQSAHSAELDNQRPH